MSFNLYVAGLPSTITDRELGALFAPFGEVLSARVPVDHVSGQTRGFGFVTLVDLDAARAAIELDGSRFRDRVLTVLFARPSPTYSTRARSSVPSPNDHRPVIARGRLGSG
jgi:RNA recognition motif-containing protein